MLSDATVGVTIAVKDLEKAKQFYSGTLGLPMTGEGGGGAMYSAGEGKLFVYPSPDVAGTNKATYAAFSTKEVRGIVKTLQDKGVEFDTFEMPGVTWDGAIAKMDGMEGAWFKDPDGNILNIVSM